MSEVPLVSTSSAPASTVSVPGTSTAIPGLAGDIVLESLSTTQRALSGEAQVPSFFLPPVFRLMLRVSEGLRAKIWNNEFIDFHAFLASPVSEDKY